MQRKLVALSALLLLAVPALRAQIVNPNPSVPERMGQSPNAISTAVPFLSLSPDARSSGMGDIGVATTPDLYSQHYNAAKYVFMEKDYGAALTYSPWLLNLVPDMSLVYLSGMYKFDDRNALAASLLYFSMGDVTFTDEQGGSAQTFRPNEFAIDVSYSRKIIDVLSIAVTGRFIYSNLTLGQYVQGQDTKAGLAGAADIGLYYKQDFEVKNFKGGTLMAGLSITNVGNKMSYSDNLEDVDRNFLPAALRLGIGFDWHINDYNSVGFYGEAYKLLVPTPPIVGGTRGDSIILGRTNRVNVMQGIFQSFGDAPGGFKEEMQEIMWSLGAEYWWRDIVAVRLGYFHESKYKGDRQYFSLGVGLQYKMVGLDFSYLIPTSQTAGSNPLKNTLRVGVKFSFDKKKKSGE